MKKAVVLALTVGLQVAGDVCLSRGMRQVGTAAMPSLASVVAIGLRALANPWVVLGGALLIAFLIVYLVALSYLDLSYVLPMTASSYVLTALSAAWVLGESVDLIRWIGTLAISAGVLVVGRSERGRSEGAAGGPPAARGIGVVHAESGRAWR